jgi:hypothetical protein
MDRVNEQVKFCGSVKQGWSKLHSGQGDVVTEGDTFFDTIKEELRNGTIEEKGHSPSSADLPALETLLNEVTPDNIHPEIQTGDAVGREVLK